MGHRPRFAGLANRLDTIGNRDPTRSDRRVVVDHVVGRLVRWRSGQIGGVQAKDLEDLIIIGRPARVAQHLRNPVRLALALGIALVDLPAPRIRNDEPHQTGPDDEPDDQQPPVELGVHVARVQGSAARTPPPAPPWSFQGDSPVHSQDD